MEITSNDMVISYEKIVCGCDLDLVGRFVCFFPGKDDEGTNDVLHLGLEGGPLSRRAP